MPRNLLWSFAGQSQPKPKTLVGVRRPKILIPNAGWVLVESQGTKTKLKIVNEEKPLNCIRWGGGALQSTQSCHPVSCEPLIGSVNWLRRTDACKSQMVQMYKAVLQSEDPGLHLHSLPLLMAAGWEGCVMGGCGSPAMQRAFGMRNKL